VGPEAAPTAHFVWRTCAGAACTPLRRAAPPVNELQLLLTTLSDPALQASVCDPVSGLVLSVQVKLEPDWMVTLPGFWSGEHTNEPLVHDETLVWQELAVVRGAQVGWPMVSSSPA
jgi:hypothetical protein